MYPVTCMTCLGLSRQRSKIERRHTHLNNGTECFPLSLLREDVLEYL